MARTCRACSLDDREALDRALAAGEPLTRLAEQYGVSARSLGRHRSEHVTPAAAASAVASALTADDPALALVADEGRDLVRWLSTLADDLDAARGRALADRDDRALLAVIRECRGLADSLARIRGEVADVTVALSLSASSEWQEVRSRVLAALLPYPDARLAVLSALAGVVPEPPVVDGAP